MPRQKPAFRYSTQDLSERWARLHRGDCEPWPDERHVERLGRKNVELGSWISASGGPARVAEGLQAAWQEFHEGHFEAAAHRGAGLGALGATVANKAAGVYAPHTDGEHAARMLSAAIERGERAVAAMPSYANAHYMLGLVLGRYGQCISILEALARGLGPRVRSCLERTLELEPLHAEAHIAMGLYHSEIVGKLGALAASLTHGASAKAALVHFRRAMRLLPSAPVAYLEHANGLLLLDAALHRDEARALYVKAARCEPADAMEQLDVQAAQARLRSLHD